MNLIIPMAGKGTRLRPQTLTTPKPLIEIAGKTIIQRIVELVRKNSSKKISHISFIITNEDKNIEKKLSKICTHYNIKHSIYYQHEAKGTAHAIYCAKDKLDGPVLIIFADTLFETDFNFPLNADGCVFVKEVDDPSSYGVVKNDQSGRILEFVEKPITNISNLAIVGIYYFSEGIRLANAINHILINKLKDKGEYQITTALENMKNEGLQFLSFKINKWFDFGTPKTLLDSHHEILQKENPTTISFKDTTIIPPCYIADGVEIKKSKIGPNVSIGKNTNITSSEIKNTIIQSNCNIKDAHFNNSILGNFVEYDRDFKDVNIGDYSKFK